jgi:transcriptional regulator with XRE-family HTH domain
MHDDLSTAVDSAARDALRFHLVFRRAKQKLSQSALAERAGVSRPVISELEQGRGNVTLGVLSRIAAALDATPAQLLTVPSRGSTDEDVLRRDKEGLENFVDAWDFLEALDESGDAAEEVARYSKRGRRPAVRT